jgi:branched-subunit amino acid aminotransferase/4-amino-4-deoxychorismate lyase
MAELNGSPATPEALRALALLNYGHFTSLRVDEQHVRGLSHHLDRLVRDCRTLFGTDLDRERVRHFLRHVTAGQPGSFVVRVTVFDPSLELGHPAKTAEPAVLVTTRPSGAWPPPPIRVQTVIYRRDLPEVKHVGLFGALWRRRQAQLNGYDDALFIDADSFIHEGTTWNIGFFDGQRVTWPNADVLPGVTMRLLQEVHEQSVTAPVHLRDLRKMQAAFATNTSVGVRAIGAIDNVELTRDHAICDVLRREYDDVPAERL